MRDVERDENTRALVGRALAAHHGDQPPIARSHAISELVGAIALIAIGSPDPVGSIMVAIGALSTIGTAAASGMPIEIDPDRGERGMA